MKQRVKVHPIAQLALTGVVVVLVVTILGRPASGGGNPPADFTPSGMVGLFNAPNCPAGWREAPTVNGRVIVGTTDSLAVGHTVGSPYGNQENRTHTHQLTVTVPLPARAVAGADGSNQQGAQNGTYMVTGETSATNANIPMIQLLACEHP